MDPDLARKLVAGMSRAREIQATDDAPSEQLQARVIAAAHDQGVTPGFERVLVLDRMVWRASVTTERGRLERVVSFVRETADEQLAVDTAWEDAFRDLGVLD